ncbi:hypothetical protein WME91_03955 [Sorangium sp. So ce269]
MRLVVLAKHWVLQVLSLSRLVMMPTSLPVGVPSSLIAIVVWAV